MNEAGIGGLHGPQDNGVFTDMDSPSLGGAHLSGVVVENKVKTTDSAADAILKTATKVCLFAHYHHLGIAAGYMLYYLDALRDAGFATVVVSTAAMPEEEAIKIRARCTVLIMRENTGLDFGGWSDALRRYPDIKPDLLLLTNDSVYGPITNLTAYIESLTAVPADFYGAVESLQITPHIQSWFVLLRPTAYRSAAFLQLMAKGPANGLAKFDLISAYEAGLSQALRDEGLVCHVPFTPAGRGRLTTRWPINPMQILWRPLIERFGVPFMKVELLRSNPSGVDVDDALIVVERRNPVLAALIREDCAQRGRLTQKPTRIHWQQSMAKLARDMELSPNTVASMANYAAFRFWWGSVKLVRRVAVLAGRR
jgi:lipopolysaccharide biosynthesis protein